jgi:hypothetical protein
MKALTESDKRAVLDFVNDELDLLPLKQLTAPAPELVQQPASKRRTLQRFRDEPESDTPVTLSEVLEYQTAKFPEPDSNLLIWWKRNGPRFPGLAMLAKRYLSTMATSAASERTFSVAGFVLNERRSSLRPEHIDNILLINSALK